MVYLHLFYNKLNVISGTEADTDANLWVKRIRWTHAETEREREDEGGRKWAKSRVKTVIKTLLTHQRKLVRKRGPPIEGRGITWMLALVIKSKRN